MTTLRATAGCHIHLSHEGLGCGEKPKTPCPRPGDDQWDKFIPHDSENNEIPWLCKFPGTGRGQRPKNPAPLPGGGFVCN